MKRKGKHGHLIKKGVCQQKSMTSVIPGLMQICRPHCKTPSRSVAYKAIQCIFMSFEDAWTGYWPSLTVRLFVIEWTVLCPFPG